MSNSNSTTHVIYSWAAGAHIHAKPQEVGIALSRIQEARGGRLTARVVVDEARPPSSPLHPCFEWDDVRAAELYREDQARHVLSCLRVSVSTGAEGELPSPPTRVFVNLIEQVGEDEQRAYIPLSRVIDEPALLRQALARAAAELRAFEERYSSFEVIVDGVRQARVTLDELLNSADTLTNEKAAASAPPLTTA